MTRYLYALVRCVPHPRTGEFINLGAIAGDPATGDWAVRQVNSERHARKLASTAILESAHSLLARVGEEIDEQLSLLDDGRSEPLDEAWLNRLYHDHRNVVQLTQPTPIVAEDAESALDVIFARLVVDPVREPRGFLTKHRLLAELRKSYRVADVETKFIRSKRVEIYVGDRVHARIDFAVGDRHAVQLAQAWSFQKGGVEDVSIEVKSWGYAVRRLRDGENARIIDEQDHFSNVGRNVSVEVLVAPPKVREQEDVFAEAKEVFNALNVTVRSIDEAEQVGLSAAALLKEITGKEARENPLPLDSS